MSAPDRIWRTCGICEHDYAADMVSLSRYEANGIGDTTACMACLGHSAADIADAAREAVAVVDYPSEMLPAYCEHCAANGHDDHEHGCPRYCRTHCCELDEAGCGYCVLDDAADEAGIGRRSRAHLWATGTVR